MAHKKRRQAEFCHSPFSNLCHSLDGRKAYLKEKNLVFHQMFILIFQHKQCSQIRRRISAEGQTFICKLRREANMSAARTVILDPIHTHTQIFGSPVSLQYNKCDLNLSDICVIWRIYVSACFAPHTHTHS